MRCEVCGDAEATALVASRTGVRERVCGGCLVCPLHDVLASTCGCEVSADMRIAAVVAWLVDEVAPAMKRSIDPFDVTEPPEDYRRGESGASDWLLTTTSHVERWSCMLGELHALVDDPQAFADGVMSCA